VVASLFGFRIIADFSYDEMRERKEVRENGSNEKKEIKRS
jgi:hypothetical protein